MGVQANLKKSEEKGLFPPFSGFSRCSSHPPEKGKKGKRAQKADFGRFPGRAARHTLSPHLLHPHLRQPNSHLGQDRTNKHKHFGQDGVKLGPVPGTNRPFSVPPICIGSTPPFVLQQASHLYRNAFVKILVVVVTGDAPHSCPTSFRG